MHEERYEESAKLNRAGPSHRPNRRQRVPMRQWVDSAILLMTSDVAAHGAFFSWRAGVLQLQKYMNSELFRRRAPRCNDMHYTMKDMPCSKGRKAGTFGR